MTHRLRCCHLVRAREHQLKTHAVPLVAHPGVAGMLTHDRLHNGKPQTAGAARRAARWIGTIEALEYMLQVRLLDSWALVVHRDNTVLSAMDAADGDGAASVCVADSVGYQVGECPGEHLLVRV